METIHGENLIEAGVTAVEHDSTETYFGIEEIMTAFQDVERQCREVLDNAHEFDEHIVQESEKILAEAVVIKDKTMKIIEELKDRN